MVSIPLTYDEIKKLRGEKIRLSIPEVREPYVFRVLDVRQPTGAIAVAIIIPDKSRAHKPSLDGINYFNIFDGYEIELIE